MNKEQIMEKFDAFQNRLKAWVEGELQHEDDVCPKTNCIECEDLAEDRQVMDR